MLSLSLIACMAGIEGMGGPGESVGSSLPAPTGLSATPGISQVILNWNAVSPSLSKADVSEYEYEIFRDDVSIAVQSDITFIDVGLQNGQSYIYKVRARLGVEFSDTTAAVTTMPLDSPVPIPIGRSFSFDLSWAAVPGASSYVIFMSSPIVSPSLSTKSVSKATVEGGACDNDNVVWTEVGSTTGTSFSYPVDSDCDDICVRVNPKNEYDQFIEGVQVEIVSPENEGTVIDIYETGTAFMDGEVLEDGSIATINEDGHVYGLIFNEDTGTLVVDWILDVKPVIKAPFTFVSLNVLYVIDNELYVAGRALDAGSYSQLIVCKINVLGEFVDTFGSGGCLIQEGLKGQATPEDMVLLSNGIILIAGHVEEESGFGLYVWKTDILGKGIDTFYHHYDLDNLNDYKGQAVEVFTVDGKEMIVVAGDQDISGTRSNLVARLYELKGVGELDSIDTNPKLGPNGSAANGILTADGAFLTIGRNENISLGGIVASYDVFAKLQLLDSLVINSIGTETPGVDMYIGEDITVDCRDKLVYAGSRGTNPAVDTSAAVFRSSYFGDPLTIPGMDSNFASKGVSELTRAGANDVAYAVVFDSVGRGFLFGRRGPAGFVAVFE